MSLKTRLNRIEKQFEGLCMLCGADLKALVDQVMYIRPEAEDIFRRYVDAHGDQARAVEQFKETPTLARSLGLPVTHPGFCRSCGADKRTHADGNFRLFTNGNVCLLAYSQERRQR